LCSFCASKSDATVHDMIITQPRMATFEDNTVHLDLKSSDIIVNLLMND